MCQSWAQGQRDLLFTWAVSDGICCTMGCVQRPKLLLFYLLRVTQSKTWRESCRWVLGSFYAPFLLVRLRRAQWQALAAEICTPKPRHWSSPRAQGRLHLPPDGVQMLPVLQVICLGLGEALAAANLSLEKVGNENQGVSLSSLVSCCVRPAICTGAIYTKGCSFGIWGMWCAGCCLNSALAELTGGSMGRFDCWSSMGTSTVEKLGPLLLPGVSWREQGLNFGQ